MALVLPRYRYDAGAGVVTIDFTRALALPEFILQPQAKIREAKGGRGKRQRQKDYIEEVATLHHVLETAAVRDAVITMMKDWTLGGGFFDFYPDQTLGGFTSLELLDDGFDVERMFTNLAVYEFSLKVRKRIV